jgi:hypothetical protein
MHNVPGLGLLPAHHTLLERAVDHFRDDGRVMGMILGGSLAHGVPDFYSDVDLYIVTRDEFFDAVFDERDATALPRALRCSASPQIPSTGAAGTT